MLAYLKGREARFYVDASFVETCLGLYTLSSRNIVLHRDRGQGQIAT